MTTTPPTTTVNTTGHPTSEEVDIDLDPSTPTRHPGPHWVHVAIDLADGSVLELTVPAIGGGVAGYHPATPQEEPALWIVRDGVRRRARLGPLLASVSPR